MPDRPPSLDPMIAGLRKIINLRPEDANKTIVVAGTNGKGSVCATLEALFLAAGETVGLYTSPHLVETTERIRVNGQDISQEIFCQAFGEVFKVIEDLHLSHFEALTLMAVWIFYSGKVVPSLNWFIFEVGLGGTWDATNAIPHNHCVITSLGLDHQNLLGNTIEEIAANKFGIVSKDALVVHSPLPKSTLDLANLTKEKTGSRWIESIPSSWKVDHSGIEPKFILKTQWGEFPLALAGPRAAQNSATALTLFESLGYRPEKYLFALDQVRWPGRMDRYLLPNCNCPIYLSGDHNPDGIKSLLELLQHFPRNHLHILVGIVKDKDLFGILSPLLAIPNSSMYLTETPFRTRSLKEYGEWLDRADKAWSDPREALNYIASKANSTDMILITGSLYLVGFLKKELTPPFADHPRR